VGEGLRAAGTRIRPRTSAGGGPPGGGGGAPGGGGGAPGGGGGGGGRVPPGRRISGKEWERKVLRQWEKLRPPETRERFALRNPIRSGSGEPENSFDRIAKAIQDRYADLESRGGPARKVNLALLEQDPDDFIRADPVLRAEWERLLLARDGILHPSTRRDPRFKALPERYRKPDEDFRNALLGDKDFIGLMKIRKEEHRIGNRVPDVAEFALDLGEAYVTDISLAAGVPVHSFKTMFYQRVLAQLTGLRVTGFDYTGRAGATAIEFPPVEP
jgi:hypothetical protein